TGFRLSLPAKITSSIFPPRNDLALCSPSTQRIESEILLLPLPFGPTTAVMPRTNSSSVRSANDLKPDSSIRFKNMDCSTYTSKFSSTDLWSADAWLQRPRFVPLPSSCVRPLFRDTGRPYTLLRQIH